MKNRRFFVPAAICFCLCLFVCAFALASGIETDEDGGVWDYDRGIYTDASGNTYQIDNSDDTGSSGGSSGSESSGSSSSESSGSGAAGTTQNADGSITIVTDDVDPVKKQNEDGSIEVQSGEIQVMQPETTRAPLEGDDWQAALAGVGDRNGTETPTVWRDPATGEIYPVEVVYMGIGRSMISLNGEKRLVNTVDMKWETEASEDRMLATVTAKYVWMRKKPNNDKTNLKFKQVYRDSVMRVLASGPNWTFVDYDGVRAYVNSSSLEFYYNDHTEFDAGYVTIKGKTKGKETVQLRARETQGILEVQTCQGKPLTVFDVIDDFAEVDVEGKHCLINAKFLTLEKDLALAD